MLPFFSIIVPVYNVVSYLRDCLDSILMQDCNSFEIIAVNDCSPDGSLEILREYERRYGEIKVIDFTSNRGVGAARNAGLEASSGEWVLFMDSDDALVPGALRNIQEAIQKGEDDIVVVGVAYVDDIRAEVEARKLLAITRVDMQDADSAVEFVKEVFPHRLWAWNKCIKRSLIGELRFGDFQPCEDAIFVLKCLFRANKVLVLSDVLYKYVQHEGSCMSSVTAKRINGDINGLRGLCDVVMAWRYRYFVMKFAKRELEQCFLAEIPRKIRRLRCSDEQLLKMLTEEFFDAASHVFVCSGMCNWVERKMYKNVLNQRSIDFLSFYLNWLGRANRLLSLPRRACRKFAKLIARCVNKKRHRN